MKKQVFTVMAADDFPPGTQRIVQLGKRTIGVFNINGTFYALPNLCPHQLGPLCKGRVSGTLTANSETGWKPQWIHDGEIVACPWHGLEYHIPTGQCLAYQEIRLHIYQVWVEEGLVKILV